MMYFLQLYGAAFRLICISNQQTNSILAMDSDFFDLAPGEVLADRYDPADEADQTPASVSAADLAAWEADPWF